MMETQATKAINAQEFHQRMHSLVQTERKITDLILQMISQAEKTRVYAELGFSSCFEYLTKGLHYSAPAAYRRLHSARLIGEIPQLKQDLITGQVNLSQLALLAQAIRQTERATKKKVPLQLKKEVLAELTGKGVFESKKILLNCFEHFQLQSTEIIPTNQEDVTVVLHLKPEQMQILKQAQEQLSHSVPSHDIKDLLIYLCEKTLHQKSLIKKYQSDKFVEKEQGPVAKTQTSQAAGVSQMVHAKTSKAPGTVGYNSQQISATLKTQNKIEKGLRKTVPIKLKKVITQRAHRQCEFIVNESGKRCTAKSYLEIDHIRPVAFGGQNTIENLRLYCRSHNQLAAAKLGLMKQYSNKENKYDFQKTEA